MSKLHAARILLDLPYIPCKRHNRLYKEELASFFDLSAAGFAELPFPTMCSWAPLRGMHTYIVKRSH